MKKTPSFSKTPPEVQQKITSAVQQLSAGNVEHAKQSLEQALELIMVKKQAALKDGVEKNRDLINTLLEDERNIREMRARLSESPPAPASIYPSEPPNEAHSEFMASVDTSPSIRQLPPVKQQEYAKTLKPMPEAVALSAAPTAEIPLSPEIIALASKEQNK
jgi:hypothetical protein